MKAPGRSLVALLFLILLCGMILAQQDPYSRGARFDEVEVLRKQVTVLEKRVSTLEHRLDELTKPRILPLSR